MTRRVTQSRLRAGTEAVNRAGESLTKVGDDELRGVADHLREEASAGRDLDSLLPEAFALVRETSARLLGQRHYDVQVMGGIALHLGAIAEMATGEGKTLVAALPSFLHALSGKGVHVVTSNDYLAGRDADKMGRVLRHLGLTVGAVVSGVPRGERRPLYAADVTYGTSTELGFDYLYDNLAIDPSEEVQRGQHVAFVDEIDSVLVDEARLPLIIAAPREVDSDRYLELAEIVKGWRTGREYSVERSAKWAWMLDPGIDALEEALGVPNVYEPEHAGTLQLVSNLIRAKNAFVIDRDYVVVDGEVQLVDANTGRAMPGRRLEEGLHQAIEALNGVAINEETETTASVTLQDYFHLYDHLGGMTGTARSEEQEFEDVYGLRCVTIPPHRPSRREDHPDLVFRTRAAKVAHVVEMTRERHRVGQPVLIGTASVWRSEAISQALTDVGIPHEVLNAKRPDAEAGVIAAAGRIGAVTVATDMAGRGTDIALGGNAEERATRELRDRGVTPDDDEYGERWRELCERFGDEARAEREKVRELGGLFVLGTERHRSLRIDDQLRGRCGRQGDPGETRFCVSLEDEIVLANLLPEVRRLLRKQRHPSQGQITDARLVGVAARAQRMVEASDRDQRKEMLKYERLVSAQREVVYRNRRRLLHADDVDGWLDGILRRVVRGTVLHTLPPGHVPRDEDLRVLDETMRELYHHQVDLSSLDRLPSAGSDRMHLPHRSRSDGRRRSAADVEALVDVFLVDVARAVEERRAELGREHVARLTRSIALEAIDRGWREHLTALKQVREGVHLRSYAQRDPLSEYRFEGHQLFRELERWVRATVTRAVLKGETRSS